MDNDTVPCSFVYVIAPIGFNSEEVADIRDIETNKRYQELGNDYYFVQLGNETYESWETECLKFIKTIGKK